MPTKQPRIFLTLADRDERMLVLLGTKTGKAKPDVLRLALRELAKVHGVYEPKPAPPTKNPAG